MRLRSFLAAAAAVLLAGAGASGAGAEDASSGKLTIELNALTPSQKGCMMTFVAENELPDAIGKISLELAFFNQKNVVDRLTVLDFKDLPVGRKRVRQFDMPNVSCDSVSRIIVNDAPVCDGPGPAACKAGLVTHSQLSVSFEG